MNQPTDNGYISDNLIHWTGKNGDDDGVQNLSAIVSTCRLRLSYNRVHILDIRHELHEKMVCFTDVPIQHSREHCLRYGKFGVAFDKKQLMFVGAQPVFYAPIAAQKDMNIIFNFFLAQQKEPTLPVRILDALHRHFFLTQRLSDGPQFARNTFYYEREWRLGEQNLKTEEEHAREMKAWADGNDQEGTYQAYFGRLVRDGDKSFFAFDSEQVAFLVAPRGCHSRIKNPHCFPVEAYEDLVPHRDTKSDQTC